MINENDSVATDELRYGDNDRLSARVAQMVRSDLLILLSDVDGLYTADPARDPAAAHIPFVDAIDDEIEALAAGAGAAGVGSGGMRTKLAAARIASGAGCATIIASGRERPSARARLGEGARATVVAAQRLAGRRLQAMDRRHARARPAALTDRRRRGARAGRRQEPAPGRRRRGRRRVRARRLPRASSTATAARSRAASAPITSAEARAIMRLRERPRIEALLGYARARRADPSRRSGDAGAMSLDDDMLRDGPAAPARPPATLRTAPADDAVSAAIRGDGARSCARRRREILAANAADVAAATAHDRPAAARPGAARGDRRGARRRSPPCPTRSARRWRAGSGPNGLDIARVRTPIGVIGMIYESRPNVTADAAAICLRSGNALILRGGSDALRSCLAIHAAIAAGLARGRAAGRRRPDRPDRRPRRGRR